MSKTKISLYDLVKQDRAVILCTDCFTVSEINNIISETPLTHENRKIATKRYCELETVEEIADEMGYDKRTIEIRLKLISLELTKVATKIYARKNNLEV